MSKKRDIKNYIICILLIMTLSFACAYFSLLDELDKKGKIESSILVFDNKI